MRSQWVRGCRWSIIAVWLGLILGCSSSEPPEDVVVCQSEEWQRAQVPKILCTTAQVADLAAAIAGNRASVTVLIIGDLDPHSYQLVKGDDEKLQSAQLVIASGLGLEHGPSLQSFLESSPKVLSLGQELLKNHADEILRLDGQIDPHVWLDVHLWSETTPAIERALIQLDAAHAEEFKERALELRRQLAELDGEILTQLQAVPEEKRYLVTSHDAFNYFVRRYLATEAERSLETWPERLCAPEGLAPEGQLSLTDIKRVIEFCAKNHVQVLFPESNVSQAALRKVLHAGQSRGLDLRLARSALYGDTMGSAWGCGRRHAYQSMMEDNMRVLVSEWAEGSL
ncbi:MAG: metal ABC transporter substrate-binding protein [Chlamydiia bacterium]